MGDHTRRKGEDEGSSMITPGGPQAPADATVPSDPIPPAPGRSAGGNPPETQTPLADPEKNVPGREAPSPEIQPGERLAEGSDVARFLHEPSDRPIPRASPDGEP